MKKFLLLFPIFAALAHPPATAAPSSEAAKPTRYTFILAGNKAGYESSTRNPDGSLQVYFEFNDRGRGPNINEKLVAGKDGIPVEIEITDVDYLKAPVDERYSLKPCSPLPSTSSHYFRRVKPPLRNAVNSKSAPAASRSPSPNMQSQDWVLV